jgi:2-phospho-L-lactate guanylyltransferase (CobY/MobA/RfbA family)
VPAVVIPYRGDAKRRVPPQLRAAVAVAMLGDVVEAALEVAAGLTRVDGHVLVVNADLPAATGDSLRRLEAAGLALVEASDGTTNALSLPDPDLFVPLYGAGSAERFRAHAPFRTVSIPELEADVDSDADLERLAARVGPRTRALLAVPA